MSSSQVPAVSRFAATIRAGAHSHCRVLTRLNFFWRVPETTIGHSQRFQPPRLRSSNSEERCCSG
jgi:hypothetical protein